jgi:hypothetical protein
VFAHAGPFEPLLPPLPPRLNPLLPGEPLEVPEEVPPPLPLDPLLAFDDDEEPFMLKPDPVFFEAHPPVELSTRMAMLAIARTTDCEMRGIRSLLRAAEGMCRAAERPISLGHNEILLCD